MCLHLFYLLRYRLKNQLLGLSTATADANTKSTTTTTTYGICLTGLFPDTTPG